MIHWQCEIAALFVLISSLFHSTNYRPDCSPYLHLPGRFLCLRLNPHPLNLFLPHLLFDPHEANNIIEDAASADVLSDLRSRLDSWMAETGDPLAVSDHVRAPSGSRVNSADGRSPREEPEVIG